MFKRNRSEFPKFSHSKNTDDRILEPNSDGRHSTLTISTTPANVHKMKKGLNAFASIE
jgi:hypothetical protein